MLTGQFVALRPLMRAMLSKAVVVGMVLTGVFEPAVASAVTVDQIVALAKAGVTDVVILALIDRDRTIFPIEPEQIVTLQHDGLSESVILAMLKSGREEGEQAAREASAQNAAAITAAIAPAPETIIVGHGPEIPDTAHPYGFYSGPPVSGFEATPYGVAAYSTPYGVAPYSRPFVPSPRQRVPRELCYAQVRGPNSTSALSFVTECPAIMQPARRRYAR
jgi:hypothetical protein